MDPVYKATDAGVDSRVFLLGAVKAPTNDALQQPVPGAGETNQGTTGVALA